MVFPLMYCFRLLFLRKAKIGSTEKFCLKPYYHLKWAIDFELFILYWKVFGYMSVSVVTLGFSVLFLVLANLFHLEV